MSVNVVFSQSNGPNPENGPLWEDSETTLCPVMYTTVVSLVNPKNVCKQCIKNQFKI